MRLFISIILIFITSYCQSKKQLKSNEEIDFFSKEVSKYHGTRKIINLNVKFSECGEWGGHEENILITTHNDENFHLNYQKYIVDCDSLVSIEDSSGNYLAPYKILVDSCSMIMNQNHKNVIYGFSGSLFKAKFREAYPGRLGINFYLKKFKGFGGDEFDINFYGIDAKLLEDYNQLLRDLNLQTSED